MKRKITATRIVLNALVVLNISCLGWLVMDIKFFDAELDHIDKLNGIARLEQMSETFIYGITNVEREYGSVEAAGAVPEVIMWQDGILEYAKLIEVPLPAIPNWDG